MPLIVFEGYDDLGKTTLISKLVEKHPRLYATAFPSNIDICQRKYDEKDLISIESYHHRFIEDFEDRQESLKFILEDLYRTILLDRYFYSNMAYFAHGIFKYASLNYPEDKRKEKIYPILSNKMESLEKFYKNKLIQPDLVIYLKKSLLKSELLSDINLIQYNYDNIFEVLKPKDLVVIEPLTSGTFKNVEDALRERGYI